MSIISPRGGHRTVSNSPGRAASAALSAVSISALVGASLFAGSAASAAPAQPPVGPGTGMGQVQTSGMKPSETYGKFIVSYKDTAAAAKAQTMQRSQGRADATVKTKSKKLRTLGTGADLVTSEKKLTPSEATAYMKEIAADPNVAAVEPDIMLKPTYTPADPYFGQLWGLRGANGMRVPGAWDYSMGQGAVVAILDTGYTYHPDLDANRLPGYDMISDPGSARDGNGRDNDALDNGDWVPAGDCGNTQFQSSSWHGTHVAGTIAAVANGTGVIGVAPKVKFMPVRVLGECGGSLSDIADGITWASGGSVPGIPNTATPADVINMSLGGGGSCSYAYQNAINGAYNRGTTVVVAAGNDSDNSAYYNPGNCQNVINVAATDANGNRAYYSNFGSNVDIAAPGGDVTTGDGILSTLNSGQTTPGSPSYASYQGTSMATPHIAGLAALIRSARPDMTPAQVEAVIKDGSRPFPGSCGGCGAGLADATQTLRNVTGGTAPSPTPTPTPTPAPTGNLLKNPGFESATIAPWSVTHADTLTRDGGAHSGNGYAYLNGAGVFSDYRMNQTVTVPAGTTNATLSFWLAIRTWETSSFTAYDRLTVQITDGATTKTVATYSNLDASPYTLRTLNLGNYAGKTITVKITGVEDDGQRTDFYLDDFSLTAK